MLSAAFTDAFPPPASVAGATGPLGAASVKREPCSDDEEIEVGKETEAMEDDSRPVPMQDMPEDLSVKKKDSGNDISASTSSRSSSISPPTRSSESGSPDSQKNGDQSRAKRIKPIPPPLDLNARTLSPSDTLPGPPGHTHPLSPAHSADTPRESLPLRKRWDDLMMILRRSSFLSQPCNLSQVAACIFLKRLQKPLNTSLVSMNWQFHVRVIF